MKARKVLARASMYLFLAIVFLFAVMPLAYTISASLKSNQELLLGGVNLIPKELTLDNFSEAWSVANFGRYTWNSAFVSFFSVIGVLFNATITAYVFDRGHFFGRKILFGIYLATMFISAGAVTLFPLVQIMTTLGLNSLVGLIIFNVFGLNVVYLFLAIGYLRTISKEIDDAAKIDGCSFFRTYWNIILPLATPIIATIALISFRASWNDWLLPMVMTIGKRGSQTLSVGIVSLKGGEAAGRWNLMMAGTMFSLVPIIVVYLFLNRYFIAGLTSGSLKA